MTVKVNLIEEAGERRKKFDGDRNIEARTEANILEKPTIVRKADTETKRNRTTRV